MLRKVLGVSCLLFAVFFLVLMFVFNGGELSNTFKGLPGVVLFGGAGFYYLTTERESR